MPHCFDVRSQPDAAEHDQAVNVSHQVPRPLDHIDELGHEIKAARILGGRIVLREVRAQVAIGDGTSHGVDQCMAKHITVGVSVEAEVGRNLHPTQEEGTARREPADVMSEAGSES